MNNKKNGTARRPASFDPSEFEALSKRKVIVYADGCEPNAGTTNPAILRAMAELEEKTAGNGSGGGLAEVVCMKDVPAETIDWHWPGRLAGGKVHTISGDPGEGKTFIATYFAGAYSIGSPFPDGQKGCFPVGDSLFLFSEDGLGDTFRPRLDAIGADCSRIHVLKSVMLSEGNSSERIPHAVQLDRDIKTIEAVGQSLPDLKLVVFDPVSAYLGKADSHKNADVRAVLEPVAAWAERRGVAIVLVNHQAKAGGVKAIHRSMGSIAFVAVSRIAYAVTRDPQNDARTLFLPVKCNIAAKPSGLAYSITDGKLCWEDKPVNIDIDDVLDAPRKSTGAASRLNTAKAWIQERLSDGEWIGSDELLQQAEEAGTSKSTHVRAKQELGLESKSWQVDGRKKWHCRLAQEQETQARNSTPTTQNLEHLGYLGSGDVDTQDSQGTQEHQESQHTQESQGCLSEGERF